MQQPSFFENEIVQPKNLNFLTESTAQNIKDVVVTFSGGRPGKVAGLTLSGISGNNYFVVSPGYGYTGDGERIEIYSTGLNYNITFTGTQSIYLNFTSSVWNPDPTVNPLGAGGVVTNVDPTDSSLVAVENYNLAVITTTSGSNYISLGTVQADSSMLYVSSDMSNAQNLTVGNILDLNTSTINGINIATGTIDSNQFVSELHYDITLSTGTDINLSSSGSSNIGSQSLPFSNIYAVTGHFHQLVGFSPILVDTLQQVSGSSLEGTGTNPVIIDTQAQGTRFGNGLTLNTDSISTVGSDNDINILTDPLKRVNFDSTVNIGSGHTLFVKDNLVVSGTAIFNSTNLIASTGNFYVGGDLSMQSSSQLYNNIVPNPDFAINNLGGTGIGLAPGSWTITTMNTDYAYGPNLLANPYIIMSPTGIGSWNTQLNTTGNYTIEMNIRMLGNSLFGSANNLISKFVTNSLSGPPYNAEGATLNITTNGSLNFGSNSVTTSTPTGTILSNDWYHVAYTWNGSQRKLYVNNVLQATDTALGSWIKTPGPGTPTEIRVGTFGANSNNFNGLIKNVRLSNIARTSFYSGSQGPTATDANTLGLWSLNNTLADQTPSVYNLLPVGGTPVYTETRLGQVFSGTTNIAANDTLPTGTQNVLFGAPHTNTWLTCSGINISSTGIFMSAPIAAKPNTKYNFSYYTKLISGNGNVGIVNYVWGTTPSGSYVQSSGSTAIQILNPEWTRVNTTLITPSSGSNFNFGIAIQNTAPTGTVDARFGLASMQATEGSAIVAYNSSPITSVLKPRLVYSNNTNTTFVNLTGGVPVAVESANVYINDGIVKIEASCPIVLNASSTVYYYLQIDGVNYNASYFGGAIPGQANLSWTGHLSTGQHTVIFYVLWDGFSGFAHIRDRQGTFGLSYPSTLFITEL